MNHRLAAVFLVLALAVMACGINISLPDAPTPGPEKVDSINIPFPEGEEARLKLSFGAGDLDLAPGAEGLVDGTATYTNPDLKPQIATSGGDVEIKQGKLESIPYPSGIKNKWDLKLGDEAMDLEIDAGAYRGTYELGGLKLTGLTVKDGAATVKLSFAKPNAADMTILRYETGASDVELKGLANANFGTLIFKSGAGDYTLDFSGTLKRDATVTISTGVSNTILVIPEGVNAEVTVDGGALNVSAGSGWIHKNNVYTQEGSGPRLTVLVNAGAGNLTLTH